MKGILFFEAALRPCSAAIHTGVIGFLTFKKTSKFYLITIQPLIE